MPSINKWMYCGLLVMLIISVMLAGQPSKKIEATKDDQTIARYIVSSMSRLHYLKPELNDEMSAQLFDEYLQNLDSSRSFFLQSDIEEFKQYRTELDNQLTEGKINFAILVHQRYQERIQNRIEYIKYLLQQPIDFTIDEAMLLDRKNESWPKDTQEWNEIWRLQIKNQLLQHKLTEIKAEQDKKLNQNTTTNKNKKNETKEAVAFVINDPKERILKRYERFYHTIQERDHFDILEDYLTTYTELCDLHSNYMNWRTLEDFTISLKLSLQGIGALLGTEDGYPKIINVVPGGAADRQGELKAGYFIVEVTQEDGTTENVVDMPLNKVVRRIRGPKGTKVTLTVMKNLQDVPFNITIERDEIKLDDRAAKGDIREIQLNNGKKIKLGILSLPSFYRDFEGMDADSTSARSSTKDVQIILDKMVKEDKVAGVVVDLRHNPGGSLEEAVNLAGLFIPYGPIVQIKNAQQKKDIRRDSDVFSYDMPIVVMVNVFSASASEIFAASIQDYERGIVVGQVTYGKGTVQSLMGLRPYLPTVRSVDPGALKYTTAKFYRVNGKATQQKGVIPDIAFPSIYSSTEYSEATQKHVLPYDEIEALPLPNMGNIQKYIPQLAQNSKNRVQNSPDFNELLACLTKLQERKNNKTISLHLPTRLAQSQEDEKIYQQTEKFSEELTSKNLSYRYDDKEKEAAKSQKDLGLEESLEILKDFIQLKTNHK